MHAKSERQLSLPIDEAELPPKLARKRRIAAILSRSHEVAPAPAPIDQVLSTRDIVKITGRHRITIYRWIRAGIFPKKHEAHGHKVGWLRSDVEQWLRGGTQGPENGGKSG
jgi:prophage regulatory protein